MKKVLLSMILAFMLPFCTACDVNEMSSLRDITRPYAGEYKCTRLQLGGEEMLEQFEYVKLNLDYWGDFTLFYRDGEGNEGGINGKYELSTKDSEVKFISKSGGEEQTFVFPYEKGKVLCDLQFNEKLLHAEFSAT